MSQRRIADVTNLSPTVFMFESGQQLGPARSRNAKLEGVEITELDRRRINSLGTVRLTNERDAPEEEQKPDQPQESEVSATPPTPSIDSPVVSEAEAATASPVAGASDADSQGNQAERALGARRDRRDR